MQFSISTLTKQQRKMPKGVRSATVLFGGANEVHFFQCKCSYRWEGNTQTAKDLAFRLHKRMCPFASLPPSNAMHEPVPLCNGKCDIITHVKGPSRDVS